METNKFDIIIENNDTFSSYYDENNEPNTRLKNASNINIFIGANNSGKSRFIRNLLNQDLKFQLTKETIKIINFLNDFFEKHPISFTNYSKKTIIDNIRLNDLYNGNTIEYKTINFDIRKKKFRIS